MKIKTLLWIPKSAFVPLCLMETLTLGEEPRKQMPQDMNLCAEISNG